MLHIIFQTPVHSGSEEEDFEKVFIYFYGLNLGPPGAGPSCTQGPSIEQNWYKTTRQMLHIKFQASKPSGSEEDFLIFFYIFLWFEPRTPWRGAILDPGTFI